MKSLIALVLFSTSVSASQSVNCIVFNGNDSTHPKQPFNVTLVTGQRKTELTLQSAITTQGEFIVGLQLFKFDEDLGGNYRLTIETSAVGNPKLKAISFTNSMEAKFSGRIWLNDKTTNELKMTYIDYNCS